LNYCALAADSSLQDYLETVCHLQKGKKEKEKEKKKKRKSTDTLNLSLR